MNPFRLSGGYRLLIVANLFWFPWLIFQPSIQTVLYCSPAILLLVFWVFKGFNKSPFSSDTFKALGIYAAIFFTLAALYGRVSGLIGATQSSALPEATRYKYELKSNRCIAQSGNESNHEILDFYKTNKECGVAKPFGNVNIIECKNGDKVKNYRSYVYSETLEGCQQFETASQYLNSEMFDKK